MRIHLKTEGGVAHFPGLADGVTIDSDQLPEEEARVLKDEVDEARFFDLPASLAKPSAGAADYQQHTITIEQEDRQHTVQLTDEVEDPHVRKLLQSLKEKAKSLQASRRRKRQSSR